MHQFPFQARIQTQGSEQGKGQGTNNIPKGSRAQIVLFSVGLSPLSPSGCHKIYSSSRMRCNFRSFASKGGCCFLSETQHPSASLARLPSGADSAPRGVQAPRDCPAPGVRHSHGPRRTASPQGAKGPSSLLYGTEHAP